MEQRDFFISYHESDKKWAEWAYGVLVREGHTIHIRGKATMGGSKTKNAADFVGHSKAFIGSVAPLGFNTPPLGAATAGGAGDLFPRIRKDL